MVAGATSPFRKVSDGVMVALRVAPLASHNRIDGIAAEPPAGNVLKISVTAVPEGGKANDAVIRLLAKAWRLPRCSFTITRGAGARRKALHVAGAPDELLARIRERMGEAVG